MRRFAAQIQVPVVRCTLPCEPLCTSKVANREVVDRHRTRDCLDIEPKNSQDPI